MTRCLRYLTYIPGRSRRRSTNSVGNVASLSRTQCKSSEQSPFVSPSGLGSAAAVDNWVQGRFLLVAQNLPLLPVPFVSGGISGMLVGLYRHMQLVTDGVYSHMYLIGSSGRAVFRMVPRSRQTRRAREVPAHRVRTGYRRSRQAPDTAKPGAFGVLAEAEVTNARRS